MTKGKKRNQKTIEDFAVRMSQIKNEKKRQISQSHIGSVKNNKNSMDISIEPQQLKRQKIAKQENSDSDSQIENEK